MAEHIKIPLLPLSGPRINYFVGATPTGVFTIPFPFFEPADIQVSVNGGPETILFPAIVPRMWATWMPTDKGIYFVSQSQELGPSMAYTFTLSVRYVISTIYPVAQLKEQK